MDQQGEPILSFRPARSAGDWRASGWQSSSGSRVQGQAQDGVIVRPRCRASPMRPGGDVVCVACAGTTAVWLMAVSHLATAAVMLPYVIWLNIWPSMSQLPVLAAFGLFQMALPYVFFARGLKSITSQEATGIGLLEPPAAARLGLPGLVGSAGLLDRRGWRIDSAGAAVAIRGAVVETGAITSKLELRESHSEPAPRPRNEGLGVARCGCR